MGKSSKRFLIVAIVIVIGTVAGALAYSFVYVPHNSADTYLNRITPQLGNVKKEINNISKTTESPLFNNPDITPEQARQIIDQIETILEENKTTMRQLQQLNDVDSAARIDLFGLATRATSTHENLPHSLAQTNEVIESYETLLTYLREREKADVQLGAILEDFNSISDYDTQISSSGLFWLKRDAVNDLAASLKLVTVPHGLEDAQQAALKTYTEVGEAFGNFAYALSVASDPLILSAAYQLEILTSNHVSDHYALYEQVTELPVIEDVQALDEKFSEF